MEEGKKNIIREKTYLFAREIVQLYKHNNAYQFGAMWRQLLRSGTSIGANVEEAIGAQSTKDFYTKLTIAYKEARETKYWLQLLYEAGSIQKVTTNDMIDKVDEILRIIGAIQKTVKKNLEKALNS